MELMDLFEEVFHEVMEELGLENWWDLVDSDDFEIVEERLAAYHDTEEYREWVKMCAEDL